MAECTDTDTDIERSRLRRTGHRVAVLLASAIAYAACGAQDSRSELLEIAAASHPDARSRELTACMYDSVLEHHGSEVARELVEIARARAQGQTLPSDARAVLAISLQEAMRCTKERREQRASGALPRESETRRGARS